MSERDATYVFNHVNIMLAYHKGDRSAGEADRLLRAQVQVARYIVCILVWMDTITWCSTFCAFTQHSPHIIPDNWCIWLLYDNTALLLYALNPCMALYSITHHPTEEIMMI